MPDKLRVLVVDDEASIRSVIAENLAACGFEVSTARDGLEAMATIENAGEPQVVITDIIMPGQEGLETIIAIRRKYPLIRLLAISGGGRTKSVDFLQMAARLGADAVMPKPLDIDELERVVRRLAS